MEKSYSTIDNKLVVTKVESIVSETTYTIDQLIDQRNAIQTQKERDNEQRDNELEELDNLIQMAQNEGLKTKAEIIEETPEEYSVDDSEVPEHLR